MKPMHPHGICLALLAASLMVTLNLADEPAIKRPGPSLAENRKDEPLSKEFSLQSAVRFLDSAALGWQKEQRCFSCHTNLAYLYARPHSSIDTPAHGEIRSALEELVQVRWPEKKPRWDAEVVAAAAALAYNDAHTKRTLHPVTKVALDRMWTIQRKNGGWNWLKCDWPPMENDDHYGVTLAALAVGVAPEGYAKTEQARKGFDGIRRYLKENPPANLHHKAMLLWAKSYLSDFRSEAETKTTIKELLAVQRPDGGWSAASLGDWKRADNLEQDRETSDGYGTGFVVFVLRKGGVAANDPAVQKGVRWLQTNQRESGRWFTRSLHRDNKHYLTHAGTAFGVMALAECEK